jgi:hypothetical protein
MNTQTNDTQSALKRLHHSLKRYDFAVMKSDWKFLRGKISIAEQREIVNLFLNDCINHHLDFRFMKKEFDVLLQYGFNLNYQMDEFTPTPLCVAIKCFSSEMLGYFIEKGVKVNFIIDEYFFEPDAKLKEEPLFTTALSFAEWLQADMMALDYAPFRISREEYHKYHGEKNIMDKYFPDIEFDITASELRWLRKSAVYLYELIELDKIIGVLKSHGAKHYDELTEKEKLFNKH